MTDTKKPSQDEDQGPTAVDDRPGVAGATASGMSRYVLCPDCREDVQAENEPERVVMGHIKFTGVSCDRCGEPLAVGSHAAAVSFYDNPADDEPWEHEHLTTH
jgi:hypothetical protein